MTFTLFQFIQFLFSKAQKPSNRLDIISGLSVVISIFRLSPLSWLTPDRHTLFMRLWLYGCVSSILLGRHSSGGDCVLCKSMDVTTRHFRLIVKNYSIKIKRIIFRSLFLAKEELYFHSYFFKRWTLRLGTTVTRSLLLIDINKPFFHVERRAPVAEHNGACFGPQFRAWL